MNVTSTEGGRREVRERNIFETVLNLDEEGDYSLLLDVGQKMARRHHLVYRQFVDFLTVLSILF